MGVRLTTFFPKAGGERKRHLSAFQKVPNGKGRSGVSKIRGQNMWGGKWNNANDKPETAEAVDSQVEKNVPPEARCHGGTR